MPKWVTGPYVENEHPGAHELFVYLGIATEENASVRVDKKRRKEIEEHLKHCPFDAAIAKRFSRAHYKGHAQRRMKEKMRN